MYRRILGTADEEFRAYFGLMKFTHHGLQIEIPDEWWIEAGMRGFMPTFTAYRVNQRLFQNVREVLIKDVGPVSRNLGVGIFNDSKRGLVQPANESCEFCAASGLTTLFRLWKSSRAKLDTLIDISWFDWCAPPVLFAGCGIQVRTYHRAF